MHTPKHIHLIGIGDMRQCVPPDQEAFLDQAILHALRDFPAPSPSASAAATSPPRTSLSPSTSPPPSTSPNPKTQPCTSLNRQSFPAKPMYQGWLQG